VTSPFNSSDLYDDESIAQDRSSCIGCSGSRRVIVSSSGQYKYAPCSDLSTYQTLMKQLTQSEEERRYYMFFPDENLTDIRNSINDQVYNGFDYKDVIFERTMSNILFRDPTKAAILSKFNRVVYGVIESVKQIKNYFNYTVPKNNKRVF
jgi:hypothetical protein